MQLLSHLNIRTKLASIVVLAAVTAFAIVAVSASLSRGRMIDDRVAQMREATDMLMGLAQSLQGDVAAGKITQADALAQLHQRAHRMIFANGQGYPVVYLPDTTTFVNVGKPETEGKITGGRLGNGALISDLQFGAAKARPEGSAFVYAYPRPGQNVPVGKIAYARFFAPWGIVMSYGLYMDDIDADVNALLLHLGAVGAALLLLM